MNKGDMVEIVDIDKKDKWLVRNKKNLNQVCSISKKKEYLSHTIFWALMIERKLFYNIIMWIELRKIQIFLSISKKKANEPKTIF